MYLDTYIHLAHSMFVARKQLWELIQLYDGAYPSRHPPGHYVYVYVHIYFSNALRIFMWNNLWRWDFKGAALCVNTSEFEKKRPNNFKGKHDFSKTKGDWCIIDCPTFRTMGSYCRFRLFLWNRSKNIDRQFDCTLAYID